MNRLQGELMATEYLTIALVTSHGNPTVLNTIRDVVRTAAIDAEMSLDSAYAQPDLRDAFHERMALICSVTQTARDGEMQAGERGA